MKRRESPLTVYHFVEAGLTFRVHWRVMAERVVQVDRYSRLRNGRRAYVTDWTPEKGPPPAWLVPIIETVTEEHGRDPGLAMRLAKLEREAASQEDAP